MLGHQSQTAGIRVARHAVETALHTTDVERCDRLWNDSARLVGLRV